jgi:serine/threonine-protein kinase RsbW
MKQEQSKQHFCLQVHSDLKALAHVLQWFTEIAHNKLASDCFLQCQTMLAEGFTNAVRHAHRHYPPQTLIDIELIFYIHYLEIQIWDSGQPFDLKAKLDSLLQTQNTVSLMDLEEGGRGLKFIYALTDSFYYTRDLHQERNCLVMQKFF